MGEKKISIILPVYNGEEFLSNSIESVISQTYKNWELIIVNDCSTDDTLSLCNDFAQKDNRIKVISNDKNLKLPATLNVGFYHATGEYYTWTSHDNMYKPNALGTLITQFEKNSDAVMVYSDYTNIDSKGSPIEDGKLRNPEHIVAGNVCGACFLYTADAAKNVGQYDINLFLAEDYDYWMRLYRCGRFVHLPESLYLYRRHPGTLTETKKALVNEQTYKALEKNFLPLYAEAVKYGLVNEFFDQILMRGEAHKEETEELLLSVNRNYRHYLEKRETKNRIRNSKGYIFLRKMIKG